MSFYIGGNLTRQVLHRDNAGMPSVPSALYFKHWSTGNRYSMEGPPSRESEANIGWTRMFFNSSTTTDQARADFVAKCPLENLCSVDDFALRGSTPWGDGSTKIWKQDEHKSIKRMAALWLSVACISFSTFLLVHTFILRIGTKIADKKSNSASHNSSKSTIASGRNEKEAHVHGVTAASSNSSLPNSSPPNSTKTSKHASIDDLAIERVEPHPKIPASLYSPGPSRQPSEFFDSRGPTPFNSDFNTTREDLHPALPGQDSQLTLAVPAQHFVATDKITMETVTESAMPAPRMRAQPPPPRQRIDHLAGLTALCSLVVTLMHFGLTYVPALVTPGAPQHHRSEYWAQKIIGPFLLNQMWLGVFFTTSVRFLTSPYLRRGNVEDIAKAAVRRTPRLMIPVASIALLEYFLIDIGATSYLKYIPSLTWSTWPYVTRFENFGQYISEVLELVFLVPNAVPQITLHYCTGVLWTIAVQLQGSWLVLLGAIVVYEIKGPWKRMSFYAFCLINHWYAQSWGTYLWLGLLLTDLDVTYKWKPYLYSRAVAYYPVITLCWLCVGAAFAVNVVPNWADTTFNFSTAEHDIHPDAASGEPMGNTDQAGYPPYYTPRLNGILFAGGMQAVVELSPSVQWFLSTPPFLMLFPHVFTIYLMHGLVFWTWGSWLMIFLAERDFTYGVNVAIVGVTSYALLFLCLPIVTPILEALGKDVTALVWMTAKEKSPPRRRTLFPFPEDIFTGREVNVKEGTSLDVETGRGKQLSASETVQSLTSDTAEKPKMNMAEYEVHALSTDEKEWQDLGRISRFSTE